MYVLGIDAGGTKTHAAIGDEKGNILAEGYGGAANYQCCGIKVTSVSLAKAIEEALKNLNDLLGNQTDPVTISALQYAVFGMSGADEAEDIAVLNRLAGEIMGAIPFRVIHDAWIGLRAASDDNVGVVSICGTGAGHVGRNSHGDEDQLRNLDYITGNYGGGGQMVEDALHYAFRSEEGTGRKTSLEQVLPKLFEAKDMTGICRILRHDEMTDGQRYHIPIAVFQEAQKGDRVAHDIIDRMGQTEGEYAAGLIRRLHMEQEKVPMILIGSLFRTGESILIDAYMRTVNECAPSAYPVILQKAPVSGAVKLAADMVCTG
ncbi:MAG: BadF/BadG/BcrA/BcrD ATPase family protein [bacterium]|nr:BadF/BadG/BcrA/BcrD ATPase family protein [bacterium]